MSSFLGILALGAPVTLGNFAFFAWEVPERIRWGGEQALNVHELPNNGRVVDLLGNRDHPIEWDGVFLGADAKARVRTLKAMEEAGGPYDLFWNGSLLSVASFQLDVDEGFAQIRYRISCVVLPQPQNDGEPPLAPLDSVNADLGTVGALDLSALPAVASAVGNASAAVAGVASLVPGGAGVAGVSLALGQASAAAAGAVITTDAALQAASGLSDPAFAAGFLGIQAAAYQAANASLAAAYLGRMVVTAGGVQ